MGVYSNFTHMEYWAMEYYLTLKNNEFSSHEKTWQNLKQILLSEQSASEKAIQCIIQLHAILEMAINTIQTIKRTVVANSWGEGGTEHREFLEQ